MTITPIPPARPRKQPGDVVVHVFGKTDVGKTREHNEDAFVVADLSATPTAPQPEVRTHLSGDRGSLFMVADGMGGAAAGEIASAMAVDIVLRELVDRWMRAERRDPASFAQSLKIAAATANAHINSYAIEHPEYHGMGTTATIAGLLGDTLYLAQVGDSRGYLVRDGAAYQITKDQSLLQKLIEAGELTEAEAEQSERRNIILQALGPEPTIKVDMTYQQVRRGDMLVLCSDGLSGLVRGDEIARVVTEERDLPSACRQLIEMANERGGPDNITVIVARFEGDGLRVADERDEIGHQVFRIGDTDPTPRTPVQTPSVARIVTPPDPMVATLEMEAPNSVPDWRRHLGKMVAAVLLVVLVLGAVWFAFQTAKKVIPDKTAPETPAATPRS